MFHLATCHPLSLFVLSSHFCANLLLLTVSPGHEMNVRLANFYRNGVNNMIQFCIDMFVCVCSNHNIGLIISRHFTMSSVVQSVNKFLKNVEHEDLIRI